MIWYVGKTFYVKSQFLFVTGFSNFREKYLMSQITTIFLIDKSVRKKIEEQISLKKLKVTHQAPLERTDLVEA